MMTDIPIACSDLHCYEGMIFAITFGNSNFVLTYNLVTHHEPQYWLATVIHHTETKATCIHTFTSAIRPTKLIAANQFVVMAKIIMNKMTTILPSALA